MKAYVSYVLQGQTDHEHFSEVIEIQQPSYTYSNDPPVYQVMEWAEAKQKQLTKNQKLIIVNIFKI